MYCVYFSVIFCLFFEKTCIALKNLGFKMQFAEWIPVTLYTFLVCQKLAHWLRLQSILALWASLRYLSCCFSRVYSSFFPLMLGFSKFMAFCLLKPRILSCICHSLFVLCFQKDKKNNNELKIKLYKESNGQNKGDCLLTYEDPSAATAALEWYNGM